MSWTLKTVEPVLEDLQHLGLDYDKIGEVAYLMKSEVKNIDRSWTWTPHNIDMENKWPLLATQDVINNCGWKMRNGEKRTFTIEHDGKRHYGAGAVMACIKRAYDEGIPILDPGYLKKLNIVDAKRIFRGQREIENGDGKSYMRMVVPRFMERVEFLRDLGSVVEEMGGFDEMVDMSSGYAFREDGSGLVQLLGKVKGYDDRTLHKSSGSCLEFYKKAQLAVIMGFESGAIPKIKDKKKLSVAADYLLPAFGSYTEMIIMEDPKVVKMLQTSQLIDPGSLIEQEFRSCTVGVGAALAKEIGEVIIDDGTSKKKVKCDEYMVDFPMFKQVISKCRKKGEADSVCATGCGYTSVCETLSDPEIAKFELPRVDGPFY